MISNVRQLPDSFKQRIVRTPEREKVSALLRSLRLHTVCEEAKCPNRNGCYAQGTATFLVLGRHCTRACRFCAVTQDKPDASDPGEPERVAQAVRGLGLSYAVITSVARDDLPDGGAGHFADVIGAIRTLSPGAIVEVLTPDFQGNPGSIQSVIEAKPDVFNHNLETVERLYPLIRPQADYRRSLALLRQAKDAGLVTKCGLMAGLGETAEEIKTVLRDLSAAGCDLVTIGQYLAPSSAHLPVARFWSETEYAGITQYGESLAGITKVLAGPLVRSSYRAREIHRETALRRNWIADRNGKR
ncbi:MAG: lipoyl synthase [Candidatus Edwardsbacteria bacterium]|nr:lipoyl synthase [Candidatus Edwardsbacteria bacterium]